MSELDHKILGVFRNILKDDELILSDTTTAEQVDGWDSVTHIELIMALEKEFAIRFTNKEVARLTNVGELKSLISSKTLP